MAFYQFFGGVVGLEAADPLAGLWDLAATCGWWWPFERAVVVTPRPSELSMLSGRLAKVRYPDGFTAGPGAGRLTPGRSGVRGAHEGEGET